MVSPHFLGFHPWITGISWLKLDTSAIVMDKIQDQRRRLVDRIAASAILKRSARLHDLLVYLAHRVLDEQAEQIHEQEVGHRVFGRATDYDTTADNIVRVHASMLRKRLEQYFQDEGKDEPLLLRIPKGNYAPEFLERVHAEAVVEPEPAEARGAPDLWRWLLAGLCVIFAGVSLILWLRTRRTLAPSAPPAVNSRVIRAFWGPLFNPRHATDIVLDDAALSLYQKLARQPLKISRYYDRDYLRGLGASATAAGLARPLVNQLVRERLTSFWNVSFLWKLGHLPLVRRARVHLYFARDYTFHALKHDNAILVGSSRSNPWIQLFQNRIPGWRKLRIHDANPGAPAPGGKFAAAEWEGFTVARLANLNGGGKVLVITSSGGSAANAGIAFLSQAGQLRRLRQCLHAAPGGNFPDFQARFRVLKHAAAPRQIQIALCRRASS